MSLLIHHMNASDHSQAKNNILQCSMLQCPDIPFSPGFHGGGHQNAQVRLRVNLARFPDHLLAFTARMPHVWSA
ncbi:MAG: hypothetical protein HKL99_02640 [Burkholderiales bacterium]|jgi:hypothetical protein|nr:hypothetical protein [Burkholderiales bacterium]